MERALAEHLRQRAKLTRERMRFHLAPSSAAVAAGILLVGLTISPARATPPIVACGDTITADTTLHADLLNCPGHGLVIGADKVHLNLNGHTIAGSGADGSFGVDDVAHRRATVTDGVIRGFQIGVYLERSTETRLRNLRVVDNVGQGIVLVRAYRNRIASNLILHSGALADGAGILLFESDQNYVGKNTLLRNGDGILLVQSKANAILGNLSSHSGAGIDLVDDSNSNAIIRNVTNYNFDTGVLLDQHADNNRIEGNSATGNVFTGIAVGASNGNAVRRNITDGNLGGGIAVGDNARRTVVADNQANHNGESPFLPCVPECPLLDDGIHVDAPQTTLARNVANENADLGIDAVQGVTDGGGNAARRNGNPLQCNEVACRNSRDDQPSRDSTKKRAIRFSTSVATIG
jgi:parallel beta-helix repeat protein